MVTPRILPLDPPYEPKIAEALAKMMPPGSPVEPLRLFRTLARNFTIGDRFRVLGSGILNKGVLDPRDREVVIHRTTARCASEYEWGIHAVAYGRPLGLTDAQLEATVRGRADDAAWSERESLLVRLAGVEGEQADDDDDGLTVIHVTHEVPKLRELDRVVVLAAGVVAEEGPPARILDDPVAAVTRDFVRGLDRCRP